MPKQPDFIGFPEAIASALPVARDNHISERFMPRNAQVVRLDRPADAPPRRVPRRFGLYALCAEECQFLRFEQNFGRFLRFTHIWMK